MGDMPCCQSAAKQNWETDETAYRDAFMILLSKSCPSNFLLHINSSHRARTNLVRSFDYPVHSSTVDVAYRTIAYKQHSLYADNPIEMVDQPEQTIQVRYRQIQLAESTWKVPKMPEYPGEYRFEIFGETACFRTHKFAKVPLGIGVQAPAGIAVKMPSNIISQMEGRRPKAIREAQLRPIVSFNFASSDLYTWSGRSGGTHP